MSYRIARGEQGVLTFEPYKSLLLPYWRFKTAAVARASCGALMSAFDSYVSRGDFVGADMARKFVQMGMTRAARYANHKGGRKYDRSEREVERDKGKGGRGERRRELPKSRGHEGMEEKAEASGVFRRGWERCRGDEGYGQLKKGFQMEQHATFSHVMVWDHEAVPANDDVYVKGMEEWIDFAEAVCFLVVCSSMSGR